ncbi:MAG: ABC transporter permease DevC [Planctomycetaceae bacterium]|jgi:putative ABC transport system permease protein
MWDTFLIAWRQLSYQRMKLVVACAGVVVAVMLMLVQLGIREGALENSIAIAVKVQADLVVISPRTKTIFQSTQFPRRLLMRLAGHPSVDHVQEMYMSLARWRNPWEFREHPISVFGVDPRSPLIDFPGYSGLADELQLPDRLIFDRNNRVMYGPVREHLAAEGFLETEINHRRVRVIGAIPVGISIVSDGNLFLSPANFLRLFPQRNPGAIDLGLIRLKPGADRMTVLEELRPLLGAEARLLTRDQLVDSESRFVRESAPIDFIFGMGAVVGFFIGFVVVYQILYTEVTNHLPQFATMKAMGFSDRTLLSIVYYQGLLLSVLGYIPGFFLALWLYQVATKAIQMPFSMTWNRGIWVFLLTVVMCLLSATIALQRVRRVDPADVF